VIFGDAPSASGVPAVSGYVLVDDQGQAIELVVDEAALHAQGGVRALNHQRVTVTGQSALTAGGAALPIFAVQSLSLHGGPRTDDAVAAEQAVNGPQPWVTILCQFPDVLGQPHPVSWFNTLMFGTTPPGLDHYWRELSFNNVNLTGSEVHGWYTLPQPRSYYVYGNPAHLDFGRAANDCTAVANNDVYFPNFVGISLMFNGDLDGYAWGGSWSLNIDGMFKTYRMTWVPPWGYNNQGPIAHEMGHGFGLHHSSGPYAATYDSRWDVMSDIWDSCYPPDPSYGCLGVHTIAYHKDILGWIPSAQKYTAPLNSKATLTMERLGQPTSGTSYLMAQIPIPGTSQFYTVEARRFAGYDTRLPGEAVVLHKVNPLLSDRNAQVVDTDGNGNPNDAGAMWLPGETFVDSLNAIMVSVISQAATSFQVMVQFGTPPSTPKASSDFNGDGKSDVLWRDVTGTVAMWLMNGSTIASNSFVGSVSTAWSPVGVGSKDFGDFNGDGKADVLWRNTITGDLALWLMNGPTIASNNFLGNVSTAWTPVRVGDFDGDGKADILWRDSSGNVAMWLMNGATMLSNTFVTNVPMTWTPVMTGDFNGDGKADILWRNTATGDVAVWLMNGATIASSSFVMTVPTAWQPVGVGDFDGDGKADVLWHNTVTGDLALWLMNGTAVASNVFMGNVATAWTPARIGDFNGDGTADILWRNSTTGDVALWVMNGATVAGNAFVTNVPTTWVPQ